MTVTPLLDPRIHALSARLRDLVDLERRVAAEIAATRAELAALTPKRRGLKPPCATERAYQWHRHNGPWPLPAEDPCGCRAAHAAHWRAKYGSEAA